MMAGRLLWEFGGNAAGLSLILILVVLSDLTSRYGVRDQITPRAVELSQHRYTQHKLNDMKPSVTPSATTSQVNSKLSVRRRSRSAILRGIVVAGAAVLGTVGGSGMLTSTQVATAAECDCWDDSCDSCSSGGSRLMENCLIYKSLDALAGGIEKVLGLDKSCGCDEFGCDDACDAATMQELMMMPVEPMQLPSVTHSHSTPSAPVLAAPHVPAPPSGPPVDVRPMGPPAYHVPNAIETAPAEPSGQQLGTPVDNDVINPPANVEPVPQPMPEPTPEKTPPPKKDGGLFDSLDDPFSDDEVRSYRPYRNVRPSGYLQRPGSTNRYQQRIGTPARKATHRTPSRAPILNAPVRQTSAAQPIGSGLVRTHRVAPKPTTYRPEVRRTTTTSTTRTGRAGSQQRVVDLTPSGYLSSNRSASNAR